MFSRGSSASGKAFTRYAGKGAPVTRPAYIIDVVKKLKSLEDFQGLPEEELSSKAEELTDPEKLWSLYFSGVVLDPAREHIERNLQGVNESTFAERVEKVTVPVKLRIEPVRCGDQYGVLSYTSLLLKHYGALHASLLVGDAVQLEWNTAGLVIPTGKSIQPETQQAVQRSNSPVEATAGPINDLQHCNVEAEIIQEFEATYAKKELIERLMKIITKYNKSYFYHPIFRSCQKFAADSLSSLGYPVHPKLQNTLGEYYKEVKKGMKRRLAFSSHTDLDTYVTNALESRGVALPEAEYLMSEYFSFHVQGMTESKVVVRWQCPAQGCRMSQLEGTFDVMETVAYRMLQASTN